MTKQADCPAGQGYVAGETMITMADWTHKPAKDIRAGDRVQCGANRAAAVADVITGYEDELASLTTYDGNCLKATGSYPIGTIRGFIALSELVMSDVIMTEGGEQLTVHLRTEKYGGAVYGFTLERPGPIICGGILAGDYEIAG